MATICNMCKTGMHESKPCAQHSHTHEVWITLPDGNSFVAGKAWNEDQANYIRCQLDTCAKKAGWRYVYRVKVA